MKRGPSSRALLLAAALLARPLAAQWVNATAGWQVAGVVTTGGGGGTGLLTLNGLTADPQSFAKVDDTNVALGIVSSGSTHTFTITWAGTLGQSRGGFGASVAAASGYAKATTGTFSFVSSIPQADVASLVSDLAAKEASANKGAASGYASLDGSTKVPIAQLPTGSTSSTVTIGNDSRLSDARTPTTHASSHQNGGSDEVATATAGANAIPKAGAGGKLAVGWVPVAVGDAGSGGTAGLVPAPATGDATKFLRGDMAYVTIPGGGDALTANPLSQFAQTTSAQLRATVSDESGTGPALFQGGDLGAATATSINSTAIPSSKTLVVTTDIGASVEAYDADLAALAAVSSNGLLARTGAGTASARTVTGTTNEVAVANGDGASGNPTLSLPSTLELSGKVVLLPGGPLASIPATCTIRQVYVATDQTGGYNFYVCTATNTWTLMSPAGNPFTDATALAFATGDSSKLWKLDLSGFTTGTTRTQAPPNANGTLVLRDDTATLTNKRVSPRVGSTTSSATPTINTDSVDYYELTAQTVDITSFTTNLTGTPTNAQTLWISITGTASRAITWGASFEASTIPLPTTTSSTTRLDCGFVWNTATSKWRLVATA